MDCGLWDALGGLFRVWKMGVYAEWLGGLHRVAGLGGAGRWSARVRYRDIHRVYERAVPLVRLGHPYLRPGAGNGRL